MKKSGSVAMTIVITVVIVILCLMCFVSFPVPYLGSGVPQEYNSVVSIINYGADLGGGYTATYYPEGVISAEEFDSEVKQYASKLESAKTEVQKEAIQENWKEYAATYVAWTGSAVEEIGEEYPEAAADNAVLYMEKSSVCAKDDNDNWVVSDDFEEEFEDTLTVIAKRFDKKNLSYLSVAKVNGYAIRVDVPSTVDDYETLFEQMGYGGDFYLKNASSDRKLLPKTDHPISDYISSATSGVSGETGYVTLTMTSDGRDELASITTVIADSDDQVLYFYVGDNELISLTVDEEIDQRRLSISGSFTEETAENVAIVIQSCIDLGGTDLTLSASVSEYALDSTDAVEFALYLIFGIAILIMAIFSIVRYRGLGVAHTFGYLSYLICMLMYIAFLPNMVLTAGGVAALLLTSVLTVLTEYYIFEGIRKEFGVGKTLDAAIKDGYKRTAAPVWDTHILLLVMSIVLYFIGVGEMVSFAYIFGLGVLMSGIVVWLTRFYWYCMRGLVQRPAQYKFCGFKREVAYDDDEEE